jgi:hypothetical protein
MKTIFILFLLLINFCALGQSNTLSDLIKDRKRASVSFEKTDSSLDIGKKAPILLGSGFLIKKSNKIYGITNAHVAKAIKNKERILIGINTNFGKFYGLVYLLKIEENKDIAIFSYFGNILNPKHIIDTIKWDQQSVGISVIAKDEDILEGNEVISIGYPLHIGATSVKNDPIIRRGIIAQKDQGNGTFILDGMSNPGNSGSPVFDVNTGDLIGMIRSYPQDFISAYDEHGNLIVNLPYNSGLTTCITAYEILKLIP